MRKNEPYTLKIDVAVAKKARKSVVSFFHSLKKPFLAPYPRQRAFVVAFDSSEVVWGVPGQVNIDGKWEITIDLANTTFGREKGYTPHDLLAILFNEFVSHDVTEALTMAMVYTADVEVNGKNAVNESLVTREVGKLYELVEKSVRLIGMI